MRKVTLLFTLIILLLAYIYILIPKYKFFVSRNGQKVYIFNVATGKLSVHKLKLECVNKTPLPYCESQEKSFDISTAKPVLNLEPIKTIYVDKPPPKDLLDLKEIEK